MSTTITISNIQVQLTLEQLAAAVHQLKPGDRAEFIKMLADVELDAELTQLITDLYSQPPIDEISDDVILTEVRAVREQRS